MLIQKLRLQRGWSQQQLAELSGLSNRTIQRLEGGQRASTETLKSLAAVFEIDFSTLQLEPDMNDTTQPAPRAGAATDEILALQHVTKVRDFYYKLFHYVLVMTALVVINLVTSPHYLWVIWPAAGWGVALIARAIYTFEWLPIFGAAWEKRQVEKRLGRPL